MELISITFSMLSPAWRVTASMRGRTPCCRPGRIRVECAGPQQGQLRFVLNNRIVGAADEAHFFLHQRGAEANGVNWPSSNSTATVDAA